MRTDLRWLTEPVQTLQQIYALGGFHGMTTGGLSFSTVQYNKSKSKPSLTVTQPLHKNNKYPDISGLVLYGRSLPRVVSMFTEAVLSSTSPPISSRSLFL